LFESRCPVWRQCTQEGTDRITRSSAAVRRSSTEVKLPSSVIVVNLVLLHALPLDRSMWTNETYLEFDCVIAPTLYGLGDSLEEWASAVLDLAGSGPLVLFGSSVGGSCALEVARLAPDRVAAVVLVGAKAAHRPEPSFRDEVIRVLTEGGMTRSWLRFWEPLFGSHADPQVIDTARRIAFQQDIDDVICGVRAFHSRSDRTEFVKSWPRPLVVISGDQDTAPTPSVAAALAAQASKGEFHLVEDAGHYVTLERPSATRQILQQVLHNVTAHS
jgi:pimeloyl-ACP methyl ester carboxylesterase